MTNDEHNVTIINKGNINNILYSTREINTYKEINHLNKDASEIWRHREGHST